MVSTGILGRYLARSIAMAVVQVSILLLALFLGIDLVRESRDLAGAYGPLQMLAYVASTLPARLYDLFPFAVLIGVMVGLSRLASQRELVAMRACGFHRSRVVAQVLATGVLLGLVVMLVGETAAPRLELEARIERAQLTGGVAGIAGERTLWLRDGPRMIQVGVLVWSDEDRFEFGDLAVYETDAETGLGAVIHAAEAEHRDGAWHMRRASTLDFATGEAVAHDSLSVESGLETEVFRALATRPRLMPVRDIVRVAAHLEANGQDASAYDQALWRRLYYPINLLAMIVAGVVVLLRHDRSVAGSVAIFIGVSLGVGFLVVQRLTLGISAALPLPPGAVQLGPPLVFAMLAWWLSRRA